MLRPAIPPRLSSRDSLLLAGFAAALATLAGLALWLDPSAPGTADLGVARAIQDIDFPGWSTFIDASEFLSRPIIVGLAGLGAVAGFGLRRRWLEAGVVLAAMLVWAPKLAINELVARDRPTEASLEILHAGEGFTFPSGHTTGAIVVYGMLLLLLLLLLLVARRRDAGPLCMCSAGAVAVVLIGAGIGRVVLGAHWPSDVLGAALLSVCWLVGLSWLYLRLRTVQPEPLKR